MDKILNFIGPILLLAWGLGLHVSMASKVVFGVCLIGLLFFSKLRNSNTNSLSANQNYYRFFIGYWLVMLLIYQVVETLQGKQGIDFSIFTQTIDSFGNKGTLETVLLGKGSKSFLTHHFSPILILPGLLVALGIPAHFAGIIFQVGAVALTLCLLKFLATRLGISTFLSTFLLVLICLNPSLRVGLFWEVHDEIFALPFVVGSYLAWVRRQHHWASVMLVACMLCKETYFFYTLFFVTMVYLWSYLYDRGAVPSFKAYVVPTILALFGIVLYVLWPLPIFAKTFEATSRISSWAELGQYKAISGKFVFLLEIFVPLCFLPLLSFKGALASIPAAAFLGPIVLSNFENMYFRHNYYAVVPSIILACASLVSLANWPKLLQLRFSPALCSSLIALPLMVAGSVRPLRTILGAWKNPIFSAEQLSFIPSGASVVAQDYDILFLLGDRQIYRMWTAERVNLPWQYLVVRKSSETPWPESLLSQTKICFENEQWVIRCRIEPEQSP